MWFICLPFWVVHAVNRIDYHWLVSITCEVQQSCQSNTHKKITYPLIILNTLHMDNHKIPEKVSIVILSKCIPHPYASAVMLDPSAIAATKLAATSQGPATSTGRTAFAFTPRLWVQFSQYPKRWQLLQLSTRQPSYHQPSFKQQKPTR